MPFQQIYGKALDEPAGGFAPTLRAIDVCAGAGGWAAAARGLPIDIIAAFDREEDCLETYSLNHPQTVCIQCDVLEYDFSRYVGHVDLVLGGIPCEAISSARRNVPLPEEKRASFVRLLNKCLAVPDIVGAQYWCFEDVVDVLRHAPLFTPHFILNSQDFGPQRRKRAYLGNTPMPAVPSNTQVLGDCIRRGPYRKSMLIRNLTPSRSNAYGGNAFYPWMPGEKSPTVYGLTARHDKHSATALGDDWRSLEWQELATLQGFPDNYVFMGPPGRVVKMVAQAVEVRTAHAILKALCAKVFPCPCPSSKST